MRSGDGKIFFFFPRDRARAPRRGGRAAGSPRGRARTVGSKNFFRLPRSGRSGAVESRLVVHGGRAVRQPVPRGARTPASDRDSERVYVPLRTNLTIGSVPLRTTSKRRAPGNAKVRRSWCSPEPGRPRGRWDVVRGRFSPRNGDRRARSGTLPDGSFAAAVGSKNFFSPTAVRSVLGGRVQPRSPRLPCGPVMEKYFFFFPETGPGHRCAAVGQPVPRGSAPVPSGRKFISPTAVRTVRGGRVQPRSPRLPCGPVMEKYFFFLPRVRARAPRRGGPAAVSPRGRARTVGSKNFFLLPRSGRSGAVVSLPAVDVGRADR